MLVQQVIYIRSAHNPWPEVEERATKGKDALSSILSNARHRYDKTYWENMQFTVSQALCKALRVFSYLKYSLESILMCIYRS